MYIREREKREERREKREEIERESFRGFNTAAVMSRISFFFLGGYTLA